MYDMEYLRKQLDDTQITSVVCITLESKEHKIFK